MSEIKKVSLTKKDISKKINLKTGLSNLYSKELTNDLINILKNLIKTKEVNIKNFASFKTINKNDNQSLIKCGVKVIFLMYAVTEQIIK